MGQPLSASLAAVTAPAGGAPVDQVIGASVAAAVVLSVLIAIGLARRREIRVPLVTPLLDGGERLAVNALGLPGWAAVPISLATGALLCAFFGLQWDVAYHIDNGRDPGPLANPSHYFILVGLLGIFASGWLAVVLPRRGERPGPAAVRITRDWYAPAGGLLMMVTASFGAIGFPLDDLWHRMFGQDVTLWGPTHLMMLTGGAMTLVGVMVLLAEGRAAARAARGDGENGRTRRTPRGWPLIRSTRFRTIIAFGGLLIGLSIYQGEFDFGVPQYQLLFHPLLIALAASVSLVAVRVLAGRGAALGAVAFFILARGILTLIVWAPLGRSVSHFPLFIAEALLVEGLALWLGTKRPYRFAVASGVAIGTAGVVAEWGWSHVWMPLPWPGHMVGAAIAISVPVAIAGAVIGAFLAGALRPSGPALQRGPALGAAASVCALAAIIALLVPTSAPDGATARVTLTDVRPPPDRAVAATLRIDPPGLARNADWLVGLAWQGHARTVEAPLASLGGGRYRTTEPLPVHGSWKAVIRFADGSTLASVPVFLPRDTAIPAPLIAAKASFTRPFYPDGRLLQRERKRDVSPGLWHSAVIAVMAMILALLALLGWALRRVEASLRGDGPAPSAPATPAPASSPATGVA